MIAWLATVLLASGAGPDSVLALGRVERDLTGDSVPEVLSLTGVRVTADSLDVSLTIQSSGKTLYKVKFPVTRRAGYDGPPGRLSDAEWKTRLDELGPFFFQPSKFMSPDGFLTMLRKSARLHVDRIPDVILSDGARGDVAHAASLWAEMQTAGVTVFEFSTGGDGVTALAWSPTDRRFYRLWECC